MKRFLEKWTLWLPPLLATLFFVTLSRVTYFRYENSDDFLIARTFLGFEGMRPVPTPSVFASCAGVGTECAFGRRARRGLVFGGSAGDAVDIGGGTVSLPASLWTGCASAFGGLQFGGAALFGRICILSMYAPDVYHHVGFGCGSGVRPAGVRRCHP